MQKPSLYADAHTRPPLAKAGDAIRDRRRKWVEEELKLSPAKADRIDRDALLLDSRQLRKAWESTLSSKRPVVVNTITGLERHVSSAPICQLSRISISELLVRKVHLGRYLLCRVIGPCMRHVGVSIPIEDPEGDVQRLLVFNYPTAEHALPADLDALFPPGTIFGIREPSFEMATKELMKDRPYVWVASPSDIVHVDERTEALCDIEWKSGPLVPGARAVPDSAEGWKQVGNEHFKRGRWFPAAMAYTRGLILDPEAYLIHLNRAEGYLRLGYFSAALADADAVLHRSDIPNASREKALFRASKALYGRGQYESAAARLVELLRLDMKHTEASEQLKRVQMRLREVRDQDYDWLALFEQSKISPRADAADYVGPVQVVALRDRGGGRGIVATRSLTVGELLVVAKPLISVWADELPNIEQAIADNPFTGEGLAREQLVVRGRLVSKMYGNPELCQAVHALYAGPRFSTPPGEFPSDPTVPQPDLDLGIPAADIFPGRIDEIIPYNSFGTPNSAALKSSKTADAETSLPQAMQVVRGGCSLYLLPSLFNHSCLPNTRHSYIGDLMVVRAREAISAGAEVTIDYGMGLLEDYEVKARTLRHYLDGADCECTNCKADRSDGPAALKRRPELYHASGKVLTDVTSSSTIPHLREIESELEASYTAPRTFHATLHGVRDVIAHAFEALAAQRADPQLLLPAIEEGIRSLEAAGVRVVDKSTIGPSPRAAAEKLPISTERIPHGHPELVIKALLQVGRRFRLAGDSVRGDKWLRAGIWVSDMVSGGGKRMLEATQSEYIEEWELGPLLDRIS